jgi:hypothetical protein
VAGFDAYRLFGFEEDGKTVGSKVGSFGLLSVHHLSNNLQRKIAMIQFDEITS